MKLVVQNGSRVWGGNEKWLSLLARGLLERGHEVVVSCVGGGPVEARLREAGVPTSRVRPRGDVDVLSAWRFRRWLQRQRPDALLLTTWRRLAWGARAGRKAGVPRVAVRLGIVRPLPVGGRLGRIVRRDVDVWIVNSFEIRDALRESAPDLPPERVRVLLNGVPLADAPAAPLREELGLPANARLVAAVGHATRRKGYDLLVEALPRLSPWVHAVVAGEADPEGEARPFVERARALGVDDRIHWLGFRADVPAVLAASDAFALPSRNEGMANVMLEAMVARLPVVAADVSGVGTALAARDGRPSAGWVVPPDDAAALAGALGEALEEGRGGPRAAEARWRAERWFSVERMVEEAEAILFG